MPSLCGHVASSQCTIPLTAPGCSRRPLHQVQQQEPVCWPQAPGRAPLSCRVDQGKLGAVWQR